MALPIKAAKIAAEKLAKKTSAKRMIVASNKDIKTNKSTNKFIDKTFDVKTISTGKRKVYNRVLNLQEKSDYMTGGEIGIQYKKGKIIDVNKNFSPLKVKPRNIGKVTKKMISGNKGMLKNNNKIIKKQGAAIKPNETLFGKRRVPKVPVKRKSK